jgi:lysophospholipase L1-like esterase
MRDHSVRQHAASWGLHACGAQGQREGMIRRVRARWPELALAGACLLVSLVALDRVLAWTDLTYRAARARPNDDRRLRRAEFDVRVVTNRLGFREPRLPSPRSAGTLRVVALGDSFTQGYGVDEDEAYPRLLESRLAERLPGRRVEVANLGVPGTSPRDYLGHLRDPGLAYEPQLVVVGVMANDVQDVWIQRRFGVQFAAEVLRDVQRDVYEPRPLWRDAPALVLPTLYPFAWERVADARRRFGGSIGPTSAVAGDAMADGETGPREPHPRWRDVVLEMGARFGRRAETERGLAAAGPERLDAIAAVAGGAVELGSDEGAQAYHRLLAVIEPRLFADAVLLPPAYDDAWAVTEGCLDAIVRTARAADAGVVLVYVPAIHQVSEAARPALEASGFQWDARTLADTTLPDRLRRFGAARDVPVVDLLPVVRTQPGRALYFPRDGHWTPAGHALAATVIADAVSPLLAQ